VERAELVFAHPSWAPDRVSSYERLEFLGDSVLELAVARAVYEEYADFSEGRLAKIRSHVVSRTSCAAVARDLGLDRRLAATEAEVDVRELERLAGNRRVLAAVLEAALAALFLEHGFESIEPAIAAAFRGRIDYALTTYIDHKTELQEVLARRGLQVSYALLDVEGPPHDRFFTAAATIEGEQMGFGQGRSKKDAEQAAAKEVLERVTAATGQFGRRDS
jgi:ribonuclease III